jgi:hypothetical protein
MEQVERQPDDARPAATRVRPLGEKRRPMKATIRTALAVSALLIGLSAVAGCYVVPAPYGYGYGYYNPYYYPAYRYYYPYYYRPYP